MAGQQWAVVLQYRENEDEVENIGGLMISVRRIRMGEGELFKQMRLTSLHESPSAFSSTYESAVKRTPESWAEQVDHSAEGPDRATFLLFLENSPIGIAALYRDMNNDDTGEVIQVWVSPEYRGTGAAETLLEAVFAWAKENGFRKILAGINKGNVRAARFYQRLGFKMEQKAEEDGSGCYLVKDIS
jgi:RimJ/RimL family protein N-acetyltransferase